MNTSSCFRIIISVILSLFTLAGNIAFLCTRPYNAPQGVMEEAEPAEEEPETEEPVFVSVTDRLSMPLITRAAEADVIQADLNERIINGADTESLQAAAFDRVSDKVVIFRAGEDVSTAYVLGSPVSIGNSVVQKETGYYIPLSAAADVFGCGLSGTENGAELSAGGNAISVQDGRAFLKPGKAEPAEIEYLAENGGCVNVKDFARMLGLTVYYTDSGLVFFSLGEAFDPTRGYYIAEEAEKLFLSEEKAADYSKNMFVLLPNVYQNDEHTVTAYTYPALDINANVSAYAKQGVEAKVALGPAIVAGQGEDKDNYTVVRVFDQYQTLHTQFSAYDSSVRGGVQVAAARSGDSFRILTAPYQARNVDRLKCFDANGAFLFALAPSGKAPYAIAAGAFFGGETVFAVTSRNGKAEDRAVEFFSAADGSLLRAEPLPVKLFANVLLSSDRVSDTTDSLLICSEGNVLAYEYKDGKLAELPIDLARYNGVFASAFGGLITTADANDVYKAFSEVTAYRDGAGEKVNVGEKENTFFSTAAKQNDGYVKYGQFWHIRLEFGTAAHNGTSPGDTASVRVNDISQFTMTPDAQVRSKYNTQYNMWEPCATHRWNQTGGMRNLINYVDPDSGLNGYAVLTKNNERTDYVELGSSYFNGTYAPYIEAMDRFNYWTRRTYLQDLAVLYRDAPEYAAAVSPVHEHEIDSGDGSVGDYNPHMIAGFRIYMEDLFGTIENVNRRFGTGFKDFAALDAPRNAGRGDWDRYPSSSSAANEYFNQWVIYNRTIVSQRIVEAYREALLAGFPPELIKAHQIPEGDAVAGFLGEADTRISPIDVVLADGTGYGGTRYFTWFRDKDSFLALAKKSGHANITLGEYSAMNTNKFEAYNQLKYLFNNGAMFTHVMSWAGGADGGEKMDANEQYAVDRLQREKIPRSASSGGTGNAAAYVSGDTAFDVVEIGSKKSSAGLLKSVNADGSFEGTVYLQPFHAQVVPVDIAGHDKASGTGRIRYSVTGRTNAKGKAMSGIQYGDTVDVRIKARPCSSGSGTLTVRVWNGDCEIPAAAYSFEVTGEETEYRYVLKNQLYLPDCSVTVTFRNAEITDSDVTLLFERSARRFYGETSPAPAEGGVSFDLMY